MEIEKNVPIPNGNGSRTIWEQMKMGDSVKVSDRSKFSSAVNWGKRNNAKFICRKDEKGELRIWRIK